MTYRRKSEIRQFDISITKKQLQRFSRRSPCQFCGHGCFKALVIQIAPLDSLFYAVDDILKWFTQDCGASNASRCRSHFMLRLNTAECRVACHNQMGSCCLFNGLKRFVFYDIQAGTGEPSGP